MAASGIEAQTIHVPGDQPTIQAGIDAAPAGATVLVAPGTYFENIDFKGKAIVVTSSAGAAATILDGSRGNDAAVLFTHRETRASTLNGFTIQNGGSETNPSLLNDSALGGVSLSESEPTISNNVVTHNHCHGIYSNSSSPLIQNNEIDNTLDAGGCGFAGGAAIWLFGSAGDYNGGPQIQTLPATVIGNTLQNNTQSGLDDAGGNGGVGVAVWGANAVIERNIIRNNKTLGEGAIYAFNTDNVIVLGNLIYGNTAANGSAGIDLEPPEQSVGPFIGIVASNTLFGNSVASSQGNLGSSGSQMFFSGNLGQYIVINNIVVGTDPTIAAVACGEIYNYLSLTPLVFDHNDITNGTGPISTGPCVIRDYGNISADPLFNDPANGDFHLRSGSPAIDTGNNGAPMLLATDLASSPRIQDATGRGYPVVDMGAYEAAGRTTVAPTILTLTPSTYYPSGGLFNQAPFTLTANITSTSGTPTGPVSFFEDVSPSNPNPLATLVLDSTGSATLQPTGILPGVHAFLATYPGQVGFPPAVSAKFYILFPKATPNLTIASSPNPSILGSPVTFSVHASSTDGIVPGPIALADGASNTTLATLTPDSSGAATYATSTLSLGSHVITASFAGSATDNAASATLTQSVISGFETTTTVTSSLDPSTYLQPVTFSAHVVGSVSAFGVPTGTVTFVDSSTVLANGASTVLATVTLDATGNAATTTAALAPSVAPHVITAQYNPAGSFAASTASLNQIVNGLNLATTTTVTVFPNPSTYGQPVIYTAHVAVPSGTRLIPTGTVLFTFCRGATIRATVDAAATATFVYPIPGSIAEPAGVCSVTAVYSGDIDFQPSTSATVTTTVNPAPSSLSITAQPNPVFQGQNLTLTLRVAGVPSPTINPITGLPIAPASTSATGAVQVSEGSTPVGSGLLAAGQAVLTTNSLAPGSHTLTATYPGDANLGPSTATVVVVVLPSTFTVSLSPGSVDILSRQRTATTLTLTSVGAFAGTLALTIGPLPTYASATFSSASARLVTGGTASALMSLDTVSIPPGVSRNQSPQAPVMLAALFALPLLLLRLRRVPGLLALLAVTAFLVSAVGCTTTAIGLNTVAPGTYRIPMTATDPNTGISQTAIFTMTVRP